MRPLGHEQSRKERALLNPPDNDVLADEWRQYFECTRNPPSHSGYHDIYGPYFEVAKELLSARVPSIDDLHSHLLYHYVRFEQTADIGVFTSAGYALLPDTGITYTLHTPRLDFLGVCLTHKRLSIDGSTGNNTGAYLLGDLIINGKVGDFAGGSMIGNLTLNGKAGNNLGVDMLGELFLNGTTGASIGNNMYGRIHKKNSVQQILKGLPSRDDPAVKTIIDTINAHRFDNHFDQYGNNERICEELRTLFRRGAP